MLREAGKFDPRRPPGRDDQSTWKYGGLTTAEIWRRRGGGVVEELVWYALVAAGTKRGGVVFIYFFSFSQARDSDEENAEVVEESLDIQACLKDGIVVAISKRKKGKAEKQVRHEFLLFNRSMEMHHLLELGGSSERC